MVADLQESLIDVRKAYRLLADYQSRILDALAIIKSELGAISYTYHDRNKFPRKMDRLELIVEAGKSFLPFNDISMLWLKSNDNDDPIHVHRFGDMLIDVIVRSDTGNGEFDEPTKSPEESQSELRIYFILCKRSTRSKSDWYWSVWNKTDYPPLNKVMPCDGSDDYYMYGEALSLDQFPDKESVQSAIKALRERASEKLKHSI